MGESTDGSGPGNLARLTGWDRAPHGAQRTTHVVGATAEILQAAAAVPERVDAFGDTLVIHPEAWRDFQPGVGMSSDGSELMVRIEVKSTERGRFPPLMRPDWVAVIHGDRVWMTYGVIEHLTVGELADVDYYTVMARHGPKWGPGITVDVLVQLVDQWDSTYRLRSTGVSIFRTD
jgi:hypothetical protein